MSTDNPYGTSYAPSNVTVNTASQALTPVEQVPVPVEMATPGEIRDVTTQSFPQEVIADSRNQPVLVDFWAPWCGPCKQLAPVLERVVSESQGRVKLVKMNIDDHPSIAGQLGIQSIPAVIAFKNGKPVDGFMGVQPDGKIREFIARVAGPAPSELELTAALETGLEALAKSDYETAYPIFDAVIQVQPENEKALAGLAECLIAGGQLDQAKEVLAQVPEAKQSALEVVSAQTKIALHEQAATMGDPKVLQARIDADPKDYQARFDLSAILNVHGDKDAAADLLLYIIKADRTWEDDGARKQLVQLFEAWGPMDAATLGARRKLSGLLFR